jgi:hypothetical protein
MYNQITPRLIAGQEKQFSHDSGALQNRHRMQQTAFIENSFVDSFRAVLEEVEKEPEDKFLTGISWESS